jgi:1-acyl-sn-glycerol-3-phosphate acyltransferase
MLWKLVNYIQAVFILLVTFISGVLVMLLRFITGTPKYGFYVMRHFWAPFSLFFLQIKIRLNRKVELPPKEVFIFYANHTSWIDIAIVNIVVKRDLHFIAKSELKKKPFVGGSIKSMDMIFVDRGNRTDAIKSLDLAIEKIKGGKNIIAFPEGTRSRDGKLQKPFKKGIFHMAIKSGVTLVPIAISGAHDLVPTGFKMRPGTVDVAFGNPIPTRGLTPTDLKPLMDKAWNDLNGLKTTMDKNKLTWKN